MKLLRIVRRASLLGTLVATLIGSASLLGAAPVAPRNTTPLAEGGFTVPQMPLAVEYTVQRRVFLNEEADLGTSPTLTLKQMVDEYTAQGFFRWANDEETGVFFGERRTHGTFMEDDEGNFEFREFLVADGLRPGDIALRQIRQLYVPIGTEPMKATNITMSLHPLGLVAPRLEALRKLLPGDAVPLPHQGLEVWESAKWRFEMKYCPETGAPSELKQFKREDGGIVRRTRYENWRPDPRTRRYIPQSVTTRTFRGLEYLPLVELHFTNINDMEHVPRAVIEAREREAAAAVSTNTSGGQ